MNDSGHFLLVVGDSMQQSRLVNLLEHYPFQIGTCAAPEQIADLPAHPSGIFLCAGEMSDAVLLSWVRALKQTRSQGVLVSSNECQNQFVREFAQDLLVLPAPISQSDLEDALYLLEHRQSDTAIRADMRDCASRLSRLTVRETRIVRAAAGGFSNQQIASALALSVKSIERRRSEAYRKLQVSSTAELTRVVLLGRLFLDTCLLHDSANTIEPKPH